MTHVSTVHPAADRRPSLVHFTCMGTNGCVVTACRRMTEAETEPELLPRPLVHLPNGMWAEWCECGSPPSQNLLDDVLVELGKSHGSWTGVKMLYHYDCLKRKARGY